MMIISALKVKMKLIQLLHGITIKQLFQNLVLFINFQQIATKKLELQKKKKDKYIKKKIVTREKSNKISAEWLKTAGYLNTKDQDKINYIFIPPKKEKINSIPADAGHFIRSEIDSTDFKKENLASKKRKEKIKKTIYKFKGMETKSKRGNKRNNRCTR